MSLDTIHTALLGIASEGEDSIPLSHGISLVRPNDGLLSQRHDWFQGRGEIEEEAKATRYLVCEYPQWVPGQDAAATSECRTNRFYAGLMSIQVIKPIRTLGFVYRHQAIERRPPMEPGPWAKQNRFDDAMLAQVPAMIDRIQPVMNGKSVEKKNALTLLQLGLEHFHPYVAGLLWVAGLEAIFDSANREEFEKKLCDCLGSQTLVFPNWHSKPEAPQYTVEEVAKHLYILRSKIAHGADLLQARDHPKYPVDLMEQVALTSGSTPTKRALLLSEAACYLLCQVLQKEL